jgi:hypothetical protein
MIKVEAYVGNSTDGEMFNLIKNFLRLEGFEVDITIDLEHTIKLTRGRKNPYTAFAFVIDNEVCTNMFSVCRAIRLKGVRQC